MAVDLQSRRQGAIPYWAQVLGLAVGYWAAGAMAFSIGEPILYAYKTALWPPTGLALACMLMWGFRVWPGIALGSAAVSLTAGGILPFHVAMGVAATSSLEVVVATLIIRRVARDSPSPFCKPASAAGFILAGFVGSLVGGLLGTLVFSLDGITYWSDFIYVAWAWASGDALSILVLTPWLLAWREAPTAGWTIATWAGFLAGMAVLLAICQFVFGLLFSTGAYDYPLTYLPILTIAWLALRYGFIGATTGMLALAGIATWATLQQHGPFARETLFETMILLQSFLAIVTSTALMLTAFVLDRRRAEADLIRRTAELEKAHELDRLKSDFISVVSHELRTPLVSVLGFAEFLDDEVAGPLNPTQREFVQAIEAGGRRLGTIVNDLIDFSELSSGMFTIAVQDADLRVTVDEIVTSLRPQAEAKGLHLSASLPAEPMWVAADAMRIGQVLTNLLANAVTFTPAPGRIEVGLMAGDGHVRLTVTDTGIGVTPEHLPRLFEKFYQVSPTMTREHGGTGLGLAIAKTLVEAHGGQIGAESEPGVGSTFWFTLPHPAPDAGPEA